MVETITGREIGFVPEYQERYIKDILSNLYRTEERPVLDPETGEPMLDEQGEPIMESYAAGVGATSPLYGQPQFDEQGNPIYERDSAGNLVLDARGQPIQQVIGGVPRPDVMPFTPAQMQAIELGIQGIGAYAPMMEEAVGSYGMGVTSAVSGYDEFGRPLSYDPQSYRPYYDPYVEEVIDATQRDIQRQANIQRDISAGQAVSQGAFGGSRAAVAEQEIQRAADDRAAREGARLRSEAFNQAQDRGMTAFENQLQRGQTGAQTFQNLGTAQAGLGQLAQTLGYQDVQNLMNVGGIEQTQRQAEYDVQRQAAIEEAYEPFTRFESLANIFATTTRGTPASELTLGVAPEQNVLGSVLGTAQGIGAYRNQTGGSILPGLGG